MAEQVDAADLKSVGRFPVSVRVRPWSLSFVRVEESYPCGMALFISLNIIIWPKIKVFMVSFLRDRHDKNLNIFFIYENMELFYIIVMQVRIEC